MKSFDDMYAIPVKDNDENIVNGAFWLCYAEGGEAVTRLDDEESCEDDEDYHPVIWPINSNLSAYYEHPEGIQIDRETAIKHNIFIEA